MSKDIRSFFSAVGGSKKKDNGPNLHVGANFDKKSKGAAKRLVVISDSDSDDDSIIPSSLPKRHKADIEKKSPKNVVKKPSSVTEPKKEQKIVNPMEIFGKAKVKRSAEVTSVCTPLVEPAEVPVHTKKKRKKGGAKDAPGWDESFSDVDFLSTLDQLDAIEAQATKGEPNKPTTDREKVESTPIKISEKNGTTSLTLTIKGRTPDKVQKSHSKSEKKSSKKDNAEKLVDHVEEVVLVTKETKSKKDKTDSKHKRSLNESSKEESVVGETAEETLCEEGEVDEPSWANDPGERRRLSAIGYQRYLNREGPKNLGAKEIPQGKPDCLKGLVFVITGVLDSLERDAAAELIQGCGGKVTASVSRNTSYIVLGEDAGPSKVHKAKQCGTKELDEDGLLDLIRSKSGIAKSPPKVKETTSEYFKETSENGASKTLSSKKDDSSKSKSTGAVDAKSFYGKTTSNDKCKSPSSSCLERKPKLDNGTSAKCSESKTDRNDVPRKGLSPVKTKQTIPRESAPSESKAEETLMWVDKYKPTNTKQIIGQQMEGSNMKRLIKWLQNWHENQFSGKKIERPSPWARKDDGAYFKAALLSGPPGVGKTTTAHLVCKELGFDVVEFNASDTRSQKRLHNEVGELLSSKSLFNYFQGGGQATSSKHVLIMDEVDGMGGMEDRGGVSELMQLIKSSKVPIICMCNDRNLQKLKTFVTYCFELKFEKPRLEQIRGAMMSICFKEGVKMTPAVLGDMIVGSSQDIRQVLHHLSMYAKKGDAEEPADSEKDPAKQIKNIKLGPWEVVQRVFSAESHKSMSMNDKSALFFYDYSLGPLFVQENYLHVVPACAKNDKYKHLDLIAEAADSLCWGDVVEKHIRSKPDSWSLLPTQAIFASVVPGDLLSGTMTRQAGFPMWLGRYSSRTKHSRLEQELHAHTRLTMSGSRQAVNLDYLRPLRDALARPLVRGDPAGTVAVMQAYNLARADLDNIMDMGVWSNERNPLAAVDSKVKAAFTRLLNKEGALLPYSLALPTLSKVKASAMASNMDEEDEEAPDDDKDDDIKADAMIKAKKPAAAKKGSAKEPAAAKKGSAKETAAGGSKAKRSQGKGKSK